MSTANKVSVPAHKMPVQTPNPVKTGGVGKVGSGSIKGFGSGAAHESVRNTQRGITDGGNGKGSVKGFSGSGVKSGKV